eukprot:5107649-Pleurochrysis_carterae.AAC.2
MEGRSEGGRAQGGKEEGREAWRERSGLSITNALVTIRRMGSEVNCRKDCMPRKIAINQRA